MDNIKLLALIAKAYLFNIFVLVTTTINVITGGDPGETLSSRMGKGKLKGKPVHTLLSRVIDLAFEMIFDQRDHCVRSIQRDEGKHALSEVIERYQAKKGQSWKL